MCEAALIQGARIKRKQPKCFKDEKKKKKSQNEMKMTTGGF